MDEDTDIEKLEHFLTALRDAEVIDSSSPDTLALVEPAQSSNESTQHLGTKRKKSESSESDESATQIKRERFKKIQISVFHNLQAYKVLNKLEEVVTQLLLDCTKEKALLGYQIQELKTPGSNLRRELAFLYKGKVVSLHRFSAAPYFKDIQGYGASNNDDIEGRKKSMFLNCFHVLKRKPWDNDQKRALEKGILAFESEQEHDREQSNSENPSTKKGSQNSSVKYSKTEDPQDVKKRLMKLIGNRECEYDWLKLSASYLNGARSAHECRSIWFNYLHPKFRRTPWTEQENDTLKIIAERYKFQNWEKIAEDLRTGRSAYQCMGYYAITLEDVTNLPWTDDEFKTLKLLVEKFKFGHHISWYKIASLMDARVGVECFKKWQTRFSDIKKGRFSMEEDIILVAGLRKFGPKWSEIAEYLPNRHALQVRGRLQVLKGRELAKSPWTPDDDDLLQDLMAKYGFGNWSKMCQHFLNRTPAQVRSRCRSLIRYKDKRTAGECTKKLGKYQRTSSDRRSVEELWQAAVRLMDKGSVKKSLVGYENHNAVVMEKLSSLLQFTQKRGRKSGQINDSSLQKQFHNFFFVSYQQRGGRGKYKCSEDMIPTMAHDLIIALQILDAKLYFPTESEIVMEDPVLSEMDKDIVCYFIQRKGEMQGHSGVINFVDFETVYSGPDSQTATTYESGGSLGRGNVWKSGKFFPPTAPILIAVRTMLLNKLNLRSQKKGLTVQKGISSTDSSEWNPSVTSSCPGETASDVVAVGTGPSIITISPGGEVSCYESKSVKCYAATSESGVATSESGVATSESGVATSESGVATSESGVATSESGVATSESGVATSESGVATSESGVATSESGVATSESGVATSESGVATSESGVATSESGVATSESGVATSESGVATSESGVATSESGVATENYDATESSVEASPCFSHESTSHESETFPAPKLPQEYLSPGTSRTSSILPISSLALNSPVVVTPLASSTLPNAISCSATLSTSGPTAVVPSAGSQSSAKSVPPMISIPSSLQNSCQLTNFSAAASLFRKRMKMFLGWSGLISTIKPSSTRIVEKHVEEEEEIIEEEDNTSDVSNYDLAKLPQKRGRKKKRRGKKEKSAENEVKVKRQYVKSGKYVSDPRPTEASRKSSRIPKKKSE